MEERRMRIAMRVISVLSVVVLSLTGCGQSATAPNPSADARGHDQGESASGDHDHSGWWCDEHGVPEEVCGQCSSKVAAAFQKKHDWCQDHDRPQSQCFVCHPELEAKFAAQYEAKYGKKPPKANEG
jgi:hypothetical protein